eukprot:2327576-Pleurochrysis_carterae.AAC.1
MQLNVILQQTSNTYSESSLRTLAGMRVIMVASACLPARAWGLVLRHGNAGPLRCRHAGHHGDEGVRQTA